jgi:hypothetical protein
VLVAGDRELEQAGWPRRQVSAPLHLLLDGALRLARRDVLGTCGRDVLGQVGWQHVLQERRADLALHLLLGRVRAGARLGLRVVVAGEQLVLLGLGPVLADLGQVLPPHGDTPESVVLGRSVGAAKPGRNVIYPAG